MLLAFVALGHVYNLSFSYYSLMANGNTDEFVSPLSVRFTLKGKVDRLSLLQLIRFCL